MDPVNAGAVTATLTLTGADFNVAEISVSYEIAKAEHSFGGISDKELFCKGFGAYAFRRRSDSYSRRGGGRQTLR